MFLQTDQIRPFATVAPETVEGVSLIGHTRSEGEQALGPISEPDGGRFYQVQRDFGSEAGAEFSEPVGASKGQRAGR